MALLDNIQGYWAFIGGAYTDQSGNSNTLSESGASPTVSGNNINWTSDGYLTIVDASQTGLDITPPCSIFIRFKLDDVAEVKNIIWKYPIGVAEDTRAYWILMNSSTQKIGIVVSPNGGTSPLTTLYNTTALSAAAWYNVLFVLDGTDIRIYLNGSLDCTPAAYTSAIYNSSRPFNLGAQDGIHLSQVLVWSRALSSGEAADLPLFRISGVLKEKESDGSGAAYDYLIINRATNAVVANGTAGATGIYSEAVGDETTEHDIIMIDPAGTYNPKVVGERVTGV